MNTTIKKWGKNAGVDLNLKENKLISTKKKRKKVYTLKELVAKITEENRFSEIEFGAPVGREIL